ncbi:MAG: hypothetical protein AB8G22_14200 [Saprospiraceae bacterium]
MDIKLVKREDIEKPRWNGCVHYAPNGNVFGYTWYLDAIAREWDGLVENNYESVMPLVYRNNWLNKKELHQPSLIRELGIYSINMLSKQRIQAFLDAIPAEYKYWEMSLNDRNSAVEKLAFTTTPQANYYLGLNRSYEEISAEYSADLLRELGKAEEVGYVISGGFKPELLADFYKKHTKHSNQSARDFHGVQRIMYNVLHRGLGFATGVLDTNGDLVAADFYIYSHHKVVSFLPVVSPAGQENGAAALMYNTLIQGHAGRQITLDFNRTEGKLAQGFGAEATYFYQLKRNERLFGVI